MEELAAEMRGRQAAIETVVMTFLAHFAAHTSDPILFTAQVMDNAQDILRRARREAPQADQRDADYALAAFAHFSAAMLAHVTRIAVPGGRS